MKKEPLIVFISILFLLVSCRVKDENIESAIFAPVNYVDPYIGTGGHGHTFLGVAAPTYIMGEPHDTCPTMRIRYNW